MFAARLALALAASCAFVVARAEEPTFEARTTTRPTSARAGEDLRVAARVGFSDAFSSSRGARLARWSDAFDASYATVELHYRVMWDDETRVVAMTRAPSPSPSSASASAPSFEGAIPASNLPTRGGMVRYWIVARGPDGLYARKPSRQGDHYGAVVDAEAIGGETTLPTLFVFASDVAGSERDNPVPCSVAYHEPGRVVRFYDGGVTIRRRGSGRRDKANMFGKGGSKDWPKRKFKLDFRGKAFRARWDENAPDVETKVEEINLHSSFDEPGGTTSYLRETLAAAAFKRFGVKAPEARHVVVRRNGEFFGLYVMVEQPDDSFLARAGLDPSGSMFKAVHWKYSNLRPLVQHSWVPCEFAPEWESGWGPCPEVYRYAAVADPDETRAVGELKAFINDLDAVNRGGDTSRLWDVVDVNAVVKEMAVQTALLHQDRCAKNYFVHRNPSDGKWRRIPWDMEDAFATDYRDRDGRCDANGREPCRGDSGTYCVMSCEWWNSPYFCDENHPQDIFTESDGRSTWNHLVNAVLKDGGARDAYARELQRALTTLHLSGFLEDTARATAEKIKNDAARDAKKWGRGDFAASVDALVRQTRDRAATLREYL
jgi:hypothetical protein